MPTILGGGAYDAARIACEFSVNIRPGSLLPEHILPASSRLPELADDKPTAPDLAGALTNLTRRSDAPRIG